MKRGRFSKGNVLMYHKRYAPLIVWPDISVNSLNWLLFIAYSAIKFATDRHFVHFDLILVGAQKLLILHKGLTVQFIYWKYNFTDTKTCNFNIITRTLTLSNCTISLIDNINNLIDDDFMKICQIMVMTGEKYLKKID